MKPIDRTGQRFGRLIAIRKIIDKNKKRTYYECLCDCGRISIHHDSSLQRNGVKSCGCWKLQMLADRVRLPKGVASFNQMYHSYYKQALKKNLEFNLTKEEFKNLTELNCLYCGIAPSTIWGHRNSGNKRNGIYVANGIDRIDNSIGYILSNCVPACKKCNQAKNNMSLDEFYEWLERIYNHSILNVKLKKRA